MTTPTVAVLGLGPMGTAIARALVSSGARVRCWNRSPRDIAGLGADPGALELLDSPVAAAAGADLVVLCVRDHRAARAVVDQVAEVLGETVLVNVSTGAPQETTQSAQHAAAHGVRYVTGAVMVPTPMVGTDDCLVLYAGAPADLAALSPLTTALGGASDLTGEDHAVPAVLDLAMLDIYFAGIYAHLHATALARAHGVEPQRFLPYAQGLVATLAGSLPDLTAAVDQRRYDSGDARLDMCLSFLEHIVATSHGAGIDPGVAGVVRDASARALTRHPGSTDWNVVVEDLLPAPASRPADYRPV